MALLNVPVRSSLPITNHAVCRELAVSSANYDISGVHLVFFGAPTVFLSWLLVEDIPDLDFLLQFDFDCHSGTRRGLVASRIQALSQVFVPAFFGCTALNDLD